MASGSGKGSQTCPSCGSAQNPTARFCKNCGTKLPGTPASTSKPPAPDTGADLETSQRETNPEIEGYRDRIAKGDDQCLPELARALSNLGAELFNRGKQDEAIVDFRESEKIRKDLVNGGKKQFLPELANVQSNLGIALSKQGKLDESIASYKECEKPLRELIGQGQAQFSPALARVLNGLGSALLKQGKVDESIITYRECEGIYIDLVNGGEERLRNDLDLAQNNLIIALARQEKLQKAAAKPEPSPVKDAKESPAASQKGKKTLPAASAPSPPPGQPRAAYPPISPPPSKVLVQSEDPTPPSERAERPRYCPECRTPNYRRNKFCLRCGYEMPRGQLPSKTDGANDTLRADYCTECGMRLPPGTYFCPDCGEEVCVQPAFWG